MSKGGTSHMQRSMGILFRFIRPLDHWFDFLLASVGVSRRSYWGMRWVSIALLCDHDLCLFDHSSTNTRANSTRSYSPNESGSKTIQASLWLVRIHSSHAPTTIKQSLLQIGDMFGNEFAWMHRIKMTKVELICLLFQLILYERQIQLSSKARQKLNLARFDNVPRKFRLSSSHIAMPFNAVAHRETDLSIRIWLLWSDMNLLRDPFDIIYDYPTDTFNLSNFIQDVDVIASSRTAVSLYQIRCGSEWLFCHCFVLSV